MSMTKEEADKWALEVIEKGSYPDRTAYLDQNCVGRMAERCWNDELFTYGIEYGILIAVAKIFGELKEVN